MIENYKIKLKQSGEVYLRIKVHPNALQTGIKELLSDETLKIDVAAKPEKGKANTELIKFLAKEFNLDKESVKIISGVSDKLKLIKIAKIA